MKTQFSVSTLWDSRAIRPNKQSRIMLCITINRERFKVSLKLYSSKSDYDKAIGGRSLSDVQKDLRSEILSFVLKAESLLERLSEPCKETFLKFYKSDTNLSASSKVEVYSLFQIRYDELIKEHRYGSADCVQVAMKSFRNYKKMLFLEDIDEGFLKGYKQWMLQKNLSSTTIGIYMRTLRAIYNRAINDGLISGTLKPFKNVCINSSVKSKSVLYPAQLKALWEYLSESKRDQRAIAFFFFCYLGNGMNFKDVGYLKFKNIKGDVLSYTRQKTIRTKNEASEIKIHYQDAMKKIVDVWGNQSKNPDDFIFPLVTKYIDEKHLIDAIVRYKRISNKCLSRIGKELGFDVHVCLNLARHSFATKQKLDGTPVAFISDAMGHSSMTVTQHYLKSLPESNLAQLNSKLLSFE
jgi:integrase/recombinase XerD